MNCEKDRRGYWTPPSTKEEQQKTYLENVKKEIKLNIRLSRFEDEFEEMKFLVEVCKICRRLSGEAFERWRARVSEAASEEGGGE